MTQLFATVLPLLNERQRRVLAGAQARALVRGGITKVAEAAGMARSTVQKAVAEVDAGVEATRRSAAPGQAASASSTRTPTCC